MIAGRMEEKSRLRQKVRINKLFMKKSEERKINQVKTKNWWNENI